jgi:parvulin-like peptidyl-prolyl cis-trans isomerase-like protein
MRRLAFVVMGLVLTGCSVLRDAFTAHPEEAARAAGQTLSVERLAEIASRAKGLPLQPANLNQLASTYVDFTLFAVAMADGQSFSDTGLVGRAMWPVVSQLKFSHFHDRLTASQQPTDRQIDSLYAAGNLRAFQHVLIAVPQNAAPPVIQQKQAQANALWRGLVTTGGSNFAAVAQRSSEDPGSKAAGGYLGVTPRGRFLAQFEDAAWQLNPGAMSGVVRSSAGFHIIRRPPLAEIRDSFADGVRQTMMMRFDSTYLANLSTQRQVHVSGGAGEAVRDGMQDLDAASRSNHRLATYRGGDFTLKDLVRWLYAINPRYAQALPMATDSQVAQLVEKLVERDLALQQADSAKVQLTDSEWVEVRMEFDSSLAILGSLLRFTPEMLRDSATTKDGRERFMMARVNDYFDRLVSGQAQFFPVPPLLAQWLRERSSWSIDASGVQRASERATALRASADSLRPPGAGSPGTEVRPAPGPPPVPPVPDSLLRKAPARRVVQ